MFYTYILKSLKDNKYYIGQTKDLKSRLSKHNSGKVRSTKSRRPFTLVYFEEFESRSEAYKREQEFKSIKNHTKLEEIING